MNANEVVKVFEHFAMERKADLSEARAEIEELRMKLAKKCDDEVSSENRLREARAEIERLTSERDELNRCVDLQCKQIGHQAAECEKIESERDEANRTVARLQELTQRDSERLRSYTDQINQMASERDELAAKLEQSQQSERTQGQEIERLTRKLAKARERLEHLANIVATGDLQAALIDLVAAKSEIERLAREVEELRPQVNRLAAERKNLSVSRTCSANGSGPATASPGTAAGCPVADQRCGTCKHFAEVPNPPGGGFCEVASWFDIDRIAFSNFGRDCPGWASRDADLIPRDEADRMIASAVRDARIDEAKWSQRLISEAIHHTEPVSQLVAEAVTQISEQCEAACAARVAAERAEAVAVERERCERAIDAAKNDVKSWGWFHDDKYRAVRELLMSIRSEIRKEAE